MRMLVTLDGSELSEAVLGPARELARATKAEVHLFAAGHPPHEADGGKRGEPDVLVVLPFTGAMPFNATPPSYLARRGRAPVETRDQSIARLEHELDEYLMAQARHFEGLPVKRRVVLSEDPAESIVAYAQEQGVDLIAMATHGRSGLSRLVQGSVASRVVASGVAPVLLVRPRPVRAV